MKILKTFVSFVSVFILFGYSVVGVTVSTSAHGNSGAWFLWSVLATGISLTMFIINIIENGVDN